MQASVAWRSFNRPSRIRIGLLIAGIACVLAARADAAASAQLEARLTTNKGCLEDGDPATFNVREGITVFLAARSNVFPFATATLFANKPNGSVTIFKLGSIFTNATYAFAARVGPPAGVHELELKVSAGGLISRRSCSFNVVGDSTTKTPAPATTTRTRTPTATPTPTAGTTTPSATPAVALGPHITTSRGCQETGQNPIYTIGELITVSFGIDSDVYSTARATIYDILPNGFVNVLPFGTVATNHTFQFRAVVAPPTGLEKLKLRASVFGKPSVSSTCSFTVVNKPVKTRTATRTRTSTRTPAPPTATPTATPTLP